jgi:hypothetical protein
MSNYTTLCIPKVNNEFSTNFIFKKLCLLKIGHIQKIIEIPLKNNHNCKRIIFKVSWNNETKTQFFKNKIDIGEPIFMVYDNPWFWKILKANT